MPELVPDAALRKFSLNWDHEVQQTVSKLKDYVTIDEFQGEDKRYQKLAEEDYIARGTTRLQPTTYTEPEVNFRWLETTAYEWVNRWDRDDEFLIAELGSPNGELLTSNSAAFKRLCDDEIITALDATVKTLKDKSGTSTFPTEQNIAADFVETGTATQSNLTIGKLRRALTILRENDVDEDAEKCLIASPKAIEALLRTTEVTSSDYNTIRALVNGEVNTFMGFMVKWSTRLTLNTGNVRDCFVFTKRSIKFNPGVRDVSVDTLPTNRFDRQIYSYVRLGAMRYYDEEVVRIKCDEDL